MECLNTCAGRNNNECQDGGGPATFGNGAGLPTLDECTYGTDCADCGPRFKAPPIAPPPQPPEPPAPPPRPPPRAPPLARRAALGALALALALGAVRALARTTAEGRLWAALHVLVAAFALYSFFDRILGFLVVQLLNRLLDFQLSVEWISLRLAVLGDYKAESEIVIRGYARSSMSRHEEPAQHTNK